MEQLWNETVPKKLTRTAEDGKERELGTHDAFTFSAPQDSRNIAMLLLRGML